VSWTAKAKARERVKTSVLDNGDFTGVSISNCYCSETLQYFSNHSVSSSL